MSCFCAAVYSQAESTERYLNRESGQGAFSRQQWPLAWLPRTGERLLPRLLEDVLQLALLLFGGALRLVRAALGLLGLVAGHGASGLFRPALNLVHRPFALILATTLSAHVRLPSVVMHARAPLALTHIGRGEGRNRYTPALFAFIPPGVSTVALGSCLFLPVREPSQKVTGGDKRKNKYADEEGNAEQEGCFEQESERGNYERTARSQEEASAFYTHGQPDSNPKSPRNDFT